MQIPQDIARQMREIIEEGIREGRIHPEGSAEEHDASAADRHLEAGRLLTAARCVSSLVRDRAWDELRELAWSAGAPRDVFAWDDLEAATEGDLEAQGEPTPPPGGPDLSTEARVLRDQLLQHPGALAELLHAERQAQRAAWDVDADAPDMPATAAARALSPWCAPDGVVGITERIDLVHGIIVAIVMSREYMLEMFPGWSAGVIERSPWVAFVFDIHPTQVERILVGGDESEALAQKRADEALTSDEYKRGWRLL